MSVCAPVKPSTGLTFSGASVRYVVYELRLDGGNSYVERVATYNSPREYSRGPRHHYDARAKCYRLAINEDASADQIEDAIRGVLKDGGYHHNNAPKIVDAIKRAESGVATFVVGKASKKRANLAFHKSDETPKPSAPKPKRPGRPPKSKPPPTYLCLGCHRRLPYGDFPLGERRGRFCLTCSAERTRRVLEAHAQGLSFKKMSKLLGIKAPTCHQIYREAMASDLWSTVRGVLPKSPA